MKYALGLGMLALLSAGGVCAQPYPAKTVRFIVPWHGVLAPAAVPKEIITRLNAEFNRIIAAPDMKSRMLDQGYEPAGGTPEQFGEHIRAEIAKWAPVIKTAGLKVD